MPSCILARSAYCASMQERATGHGGMERVESTAPLARSDRVKAILLAQPFNELRSVEIDMPRGKAEQARTDNNVPV